MKQTMQFLEPVYDKLRQYEVLVQKWQKAVNLVSAGSLNQIWERHILDSAQLYPLIPSTARILVDLGSGGGFPGLVLAVLNYVNKGPLTDIYLIESDSKKCVFLTEAARELGVSVHILNERIEHVYGIQADVITARALTTIEQLMTYSKPFLKETTQLLLLKGKSVAAEIEPIRDMCQVTVIPSQTDKTGQIIRITEVQLHD